MKDADWKKKLQGVLGRLSKTVKRSAPGKWFSGKGTIQKSRTMKIAAVAALVAVSVVLSRHRSVHQEPDVAGKVDIGLDKTVLEESWYVRATEEMSRQQQALKEMQEQIQRLSGRVRQQKESGIQEVSVKVSRGQAQGDEVKKSVSEDVYIAEAEQDDKPELPVKPAYPNAPALGTISVPATGPGGPRTPEQTGRPVQGLSLIHLDVEVPRPSLAEGKKEQGALLEVKDGVPTGSFAKVVLLTGADVATGLKAMKQPQPVLMAVSDFSMLPNRFKTDIRRCVVTGEVYGSLSDERGYIRANHLSCVSKDGRVFSQEIRAVIIGEDGKLGLRGRLVSRQGVFLARALVSSFIKGVAEAFKMQSTTVNLTPFGGTTQTYKPTEGFKVGFGQGMADAVDRLSRMYMKMAEETFPVIEIPAGRWGHLMFEDDLELKPGYKLRSL
jgi:conjugal transfer pilus assembly protein TraB